MNNFHSTTSMAVKAVIAKLKTMLSSKFSFLESIPEFFYDFDKGLSPQFKQYYAKIPQSQRSEPWLALAYSYDSPSRSTIQPRQGFSFDRPVAQNLRRKINFAYVDLPIVFSLITNNSKLVNALSSFIIIQIDYSFTCSYQDLLWPTWVSNVEYPLGWYIRPSEPNGKIYQCSKSGKSGNLEPQWSSIVHSSIEDNETSWICIVPDEFTVRASDFVKNDTIIQNPIDNGIMYQLDFGCTLHFTDFDDAGSYTGLITNIELQLINAYNDEIMQTIILPE